MSKLLKHILSAIAVVTISAFNSHNVISTRCQCVVAGESLSLEATIQKALQRSDAVFLGRVVRGQVVEDSLLLGRGLEYTFAVSESWKGVDSTYVNIRTGDDSCGFDFEIDRAYLIYAYGGSLENRSYKGRLYSDICTRTAPADSRTQTEIEILSKLE